MLTFCFRSRLQAGSRNWLLHVRTVSFLIHYTVWMSIRWWVQTWQTAVTTTQHCTSAVQTWHTSVRTTQHCTSPVQTWHTSVRTTQHCTSSFQTWHTAVRPTQHCTSPVQTWHTAVRTTQHCTSPVQTWHTLVRTTQHCTSPVHTLKLITVHLKWPNDVIWNKIRSDSTKFSYIYHAELKIRRFQKFGGQACMTTETRKIFVSFYETRTKWVAVNEGGKCAKHTTWVVHSLVFSLRGRAGRNQSPVTWPVWLWHTASWASSWG